MKKQFMKLNYMIKGEMKKSDGKRKESKRV